MTFEHRHENKSCSACRERVNERVKAVKVVKVFQNILGSQLLSDIQTFFYYFILFTKLKIHWGVIPNVNLNNNLKLCITK